MAKIGWISIHRKIQECDIWLDEEPFDRRSAWIDLLLLANHEDKSIIFDGHRITVKRGQYLTSVRKLSAKWHWGKNKTLSYLRLLEECEMITREADSRRTLITIVKYGIYQNEDIEQRTVTGQLEDSNGTVTGHRQATNNNINNINNENNDNKKKKRAVEWETYYPLDEILDKAFKDYVAMRIKIKKPFVSNEAIEKTIDKLDKLSGGNNDIAIQILNESVMNSWQGLFPLKAGNSKPQGIDWSKV